jgi:hypothetical protein
MLQQSERLNTTLSRIVPAASGGELGAPGRPTHGRGGGMAGFEPASAGGEAPASLHLAPSRPASSAGASLRALVARADRKFTQVFALDLRSLAAFRIGLAILLITDLARRSVDLVAHYTDLGVLPREALADARVSDRLSLHLVAGSWEGQAALFGIAAIFALLLLVGYKTRVVTIISLLLLISLHNRNPLVLSGADALLRVVLFWAIFLPCGAKWSLDSLQRGRGSLARITVADIATMAYVLQVVCLYLFAALLKSGSDWRSDGTATYYALSLGQFSTPLGQALLQYPVLLTIMTRVTLAIEAFGPLLLIAPFWTNRLRLLALTVFCLMHIGFAVLMANLGLFPYIDCVVVIALLPTGYWDRLVPWVSGASRASRHRLSGRLLPFGHPLARRLIIRLPSAPLSRASNLPSVGTSTGRDPSWQLNSVLTVLAACCLVHVILANIASLPGSPVHLPWGLGGIGRVIGLNQGWMMFAPDVFKGSTWYVAPGTLRNGQELDVYGNGKDVTFARPGLISETYQNDHWYRYLELTANTQMEAKRWYLGAYLCRRWNATHSEEHHLERLEVIAVKEWILPDRRSWGPRREVMLMHQCEG